MYSIMIWILIQTADSRAMMKISKCPNPVIDIPRKVYRWSSTVATRRPWAHANAILKALSKQISLKNEVPFSNNLLHHGVDGQGLRFRAQFKRYPYYVLCSCPAPLLVDLIWSSLERQIGLSDRVSSIFVSSSCDTLLSIVRRALDTLLDPSFCAFRLKFELFSRECSAGLRSARLVSAGLGPIRQSSTSSRTTLMSATGAWKYT